MPKKAKKVTKTTKKKVVTTKPSKHHTPHHDLLLIVGGGFIVIVLILSITGSLRTKLAEYASHERIETPVETSADNPMEKVVTIEQFSYSTEKLTIKKGTTVTWTNNDETAHSATADDGTFNTGILEQGESGSVTFNEPGTYYYHCSIHPNMTGVVTVTE